MGRHTKEGYSVDALAALMKGQYDELTGRSAANNWRPSKVPSLVMPKNTVPKSVPTQRITRKNGNLKDRGFGSLYEFENYKTQNIMAETQKNLQMANDLMEAASKISQVANPVDKGLPNSINDAFKAPEKKELPSLFEKAQSRKPKTNNPYEVFTKSETKTPTREEVDKALVGRVGKDQLNFSDIKRQDNEELKKKREMDELAKALPVALDFHRDLADNPLVNPNAKQTPFREYDVATDAAKEKAEFDREAQRRAMENASRSRNPYELSTEPDPVDPEDRPWYSVRKSLNLPYEVSDRDTTYDKDFDEYHASKRSGKIRQMIKNKYHWSDEEFDNRFDAYAYDRSENEALENAALEAAIAREHPVFSSANTVAMTPFAALEGIGNTVYGVTGYPDNVSPIAATGVNLAKQSARNAVSDKIGDEVGGVGKFAYDAGMSFADQALMTALGGKVGLGLMSGDIAGQGAVEAMQRGIDPRKAALTGGAQGLVSLPLNLIGLDAALGSGVRAGGNAVVESLIAPSALRGIGKAALSEGLEEIVEEGANKITDILINQDKSALLSDYSNYKAQGMSENDAWLQVAKDVGIDLAQAGLTGAAFGAVIRGYHEGASRVVPEVEAFAAEKLAEHEFNKNEEIRRRVKGELPVEEPRVPDVVENAQRQAEQARAEIERLNQQIPNPTGEVGEIPEDFDNEQSYEAWRQKLIEDARNNAETNAPVGESAPISTNAQNAESVNGYKAGDKVTYVVDEPIDGLKTYEGTVTGIRNGELVVDVPGISDHLMIPADMTDNMLRRAGETAPANQVPEVVNQEVTQPVNEAPTVTEDIGNVPPETATDTTTPDGEEKVRSFSKRGSMDETLPEEIRNSLSEDMYRVVRNAETEARANELFDEFNLDQSRSNLRQAIENHDPASALLAYKLAKSYIDNGQYDTATDILEDVSKELTRMGQFTQAAKLAMMQNDPMAALRTYQRELQNLNQWGRKKYKNKWTDLELSQEDIDLFNSVTKGDAEGLNNVVNQLNAKIGKQVHSSFWDKVVGASKTAMLLNFRTQFRNVLANVATLPIRSASDRVSALGQNIVHLINKDAKVTQSLIGGTKEQKKIAEEIWNSRKDAITGENKMKDSVQSDILSHRQTFNDDFFAEWINNLTDGGIEKLNERLGADGNTSTMETLQNFTYWLMGDLGDTPFVKKNFVNRLASYMKAQGITDINDVPDEAIAIATQEALKATFKDDNAFTRALQGVKQKTWKFGEVALPFVKTPANLTMRAIDYSPAGLINTFRKARSGADVSEIVDELAKNLTGTAMIYLGYKLAEKGLISGTYSKDKDEASFQKQQGMLEYAFHIGDNYYTYDWTQPAATPLVIGTTIYEAVKNSDAENANVKDVVNGLYKGGLNVANTVINSSPLQSLADILGDDGNDENGIAGNIANEVMEFPQRLVPSILGATARTIDPVIRDTYVAEDTLTGLLGNQWRSAKAKIPFVSKTLPASYDTWGNERTRSDSVGEAFVAQMVNPGQLGNKNETPIDAEIERIYNATGNAGVFPLFAARSVNLGNDGTITLSNEQHSEYQKVMGQTSYELAKTLMDNDEFKALPDEEKASLLKTTYELSNALAKEKLFDHYTDDDKKLKEIARTGDMNAVAEHLILKKKADALGMNVDTYIKKESEYKGGANQYAVDRDNLKAINEKYGTNFSSDTYEKYGREGTEQRAKDAQFAKDYGYVNKDGGVDVDAYNKAVELVGNDVKSLKAYSDYKKLGYTKQAQIIPYLLKSSDFDSDQKGRILGGNNVNSLPKGQRGAYDLDNRWTDVYYYNLIRYLADQSGNKNGDTSKKEMQSYISGNDAYVQMLSDNMLNYLKGYK